MNTENNSAQLDQYIQVFDNAFAPDFCQKMIESFHALQRFQTANGRGIRAGHEHSAWTELTIDPLTDAGFRAMILQNMHKFAEQYNATLKLPLAIPLTDKISELVIKRYQTGLDEKFQLHFDSIGPVANRYLVFLWYLNDVDEGGGTEFPELGITVQAKAGRLVIFPPYWMFQHMGQAPISNDKYILSSYFLF